MGFYLNNGKNIVIIGCGAGGGTAAQFARKTDSKAKITIFEKDDSILADLIDYDRTKAKLILQKYNLIKDNGDIILPKGLELIDEEQHGGATEYTFSLKYVNIKLDLAEVDHYFE